MAALHAGELPEYHGGELGSIFEQKAGECPHHTESLVEHITMVIDHSITLASRFELERYQRITLVTAATWHDVGKMVDRMYKERHICAICGRSHGQFGACRTEGCPGPLETKMVVGYHGHATTGASLWMMGNIGTRLGIREPMLDHVRRLIRFHSDAHERIISGRGVERDHLGVLLSWADELGKMNAPYVDIVSRLEPFPRAYELAVERRRESRERRDAATQGPSGCPAELAGDPRG